MGWNQGYKIMEKTVIAIYDSGVLTEEKLTEIMQPYVGKDIDHGGCNDLRSKDGLSADEIVCKIMEPERFSAIKPVPEQMPEYYEWDSKIYDSWQDALQDERDSEIYDLWVEITRRMWKFW